MALFTYNKFINENKAPKGADHIGVYKSNGEKVGTIPLSALQPNEEEPLYTFGLLSDIHVDSTDYSYSQYLNTYPYSDEGEGDFTRALRWFKSNENIKMVCACGDLSLNGTTAEFAMPLAVIASELPASGNIPFYTCTGNHDTRTAGGNGFGTYFLRNFELTWNGMTNFERSSAFNESFCFDIVTGANIDHYIFFSMYSYSLGDGGSPYLNTDITWLDNKLESFKNERTFVFTHLFFRELAGNLGRINGSGGIYPNGNWLGGSQYSQLLAICEKYPNTIWFSGHSHWKWDLQTYQDNINIDRSIWNKADGSTVNEGAWAVHVPSCALPIDSNYESTTSETEKSREEKPLESQGGVVEVYENYIIVKGIDFNINASLNGSTTQGYTGSEYVRYLPIAYYNLDTTLRNVNGGNSGPEIIVTADNILINTSGSRTNNDSQVITVNTDGDTTTTTIEFFNASQSCVLTDPSLTASAQSFYVTFDTAKVFIKNVASGDLTEVNVSEIDDYFGWYLGVATPSYRITKSFNYTYELADQYTCHKYGETDTSDVLGIQLNTSSKLGVSTNACWLDNYVSASDRNTFAATLTSTFHIVIEFTNLTIQNVAAGGGSGEETIVMVTHPYTFIDNMSEGDSKEVIMVNPHKTNGYILGHNGTTAVSSGNGFATEQDMIDAAAAVANDNNYHMIISKQLDMIETTQEYNRTFTVANGDKATITTDFEKITSSIEGYDLYRLSTSAARNTTMQCSVLVDFDGTEFPRTVYIKFYTDNTSNETSYFTLNGILYNYNTNNTLTALSNFSAVNITGTVTNGTVYCRHSLRNTTHNYYAYVLVPNNIVETETILEPSEAYYTIKSKVGNYGPTGTTATASWSTDLMHYTISNPTSLGTSTDLAGGILASNNPNFIRFTNPSGSYLNAGGSLSSLKYATGQGEWSIWYLYDINALISGGDTSQYLKKSSFETNTQKASPDVNTMITDLGNGYVAVSFNAVSQGFWVTPPNMDNTKTATLLVDDIRVYSGINTTTGTTIALPQNVGFYNGNGYTGADRYLITTGFPPSTTETDGNGRLLFQTSSSYTGGSITIVMRVKVNYA